MGYRGGRGETESLGMRCAPFGRGTGGRNRASVAGGSGDGVGSTLGDDAGVGTGVGSTFGDGAGVGLGGNCCWVAGAGGTTLGERVASVILVKISLMLLMAANWASPGALNGELGWGLAMAVASCWAARVASIAGDEVGTAQRWEKNSTVMLTRSPLVEGRYIW